MLFTLRGAWGTIEYTLPIDDIDLWIFLSVKLTFEMSDVRG